MFLFGSADADRAFGIAVMLMGLRIVLLIAVSYWITKRLAPKYIAFRRRRAARRAERIAWRP